MGFGPGHVASPLADRTARDHQVGEILGISRGTQIATLNRDTSCIQPRSPDPLTCGPDPRGIIIDRKHPQSGATSQLAGQRAIARTQVQTESLGDAGLSKDLIGCLSHDGIAFRRNRGRWRVRGR